MGILNWKKKQESNLRPLSENEIQKKLYGKFEKGEFHAEDYPEEPPKKKLSLPVAVEEAVSSTDDLFEKKPSFSKETTQPVLDDEKPSFSVKEQVEKEMRRSKPKRKPLIPKFKLTELFRNIWKKLAWVRNFFKSVLVILGRSLFFLLNLLDPKKPFARRFFYWAAGFSVVILLFWGVNALNLRREAAMVESGSSKVQKERVVEKKAPEPIREAKPEAKETLPFLTAISQKAVSAPQGRYVIQVATYADEEDATRIAKSLEREKFDTFIRETKRSNGRSFYLVFVGRYKNFDKAKQGLEEFRGKDVSRPFQDAFIRTLR